MVVALVVALVVVEMMMVVVMGAARHGHDRGRACGLVKDGRCDGGSIAELGSRVCGSRQMAMGIGVDAVIVVGIDGGAELGAECIGIVVVA